MRSPTLPSSAVFKGEMEMREPKGFLWERPDLSLRVRGVRVGGILQFRGSFLEGAGSAATERFLPWRQPHSCQEKTAVWWLPFEAASPQSRGE